MVRYLLFTLSVLCLNGCSNTPETLITAEFDEDEMEQAIDRARQEVDLFITELQSPAGEEHAVKAAIEDENGTEHFWLIDISFSNGEFSGIIGNDPGIVANVKYGDRWAVKKQEITDWMFMKDGLMHGNYTVRPLMKTMSAEQAAEVRAMLAVP